MALQKPPPEHWLVRTIRITVGLPVMWFQLAVGVVAEGGELLGTIAALLAAVGVLTNDFTWSRNAILCAALLLILRHPAKWLYPEIDRLQRWFWPTAPHISEVPMAAAPAGDHLENAEGLPVVKAAAETVPVSAIRGNVDPEEVQQTQRVGRG